MAKDESLRKVSIQNGNLPMILTSRDDELLSKSENKPSVALQQQALKIARAMQTTLDVYTLIQRFYKELHAEIQIKSLHYNNEASDHKLNIGNAAKHAITYSLSTEDTPLGELTFTLSHKVTEDENIILENAISNIIYPLRNALLYHTAIVNSNTDPLTKLGNRSGFDISLDREINFANRHNTPLSLMVLDIDKFKEINDNLGHRIGDCLLIEVGKVLEAACRTSDMIYRYGGDEFIITLAHTPQKGAENLAERIRKGVAKIKADYLESAPSITASIGLACFKANDTVHTLFDRADKALYTAKKQGRNRVATKS